MDGSISGAVARENDTCCCWLILVGLIVVGLIVVVVGLIVVVVNATDVIRTGITLSSPRRLCPGRGQLVDSHPVNDDDMIMMI